MTIKEKYKGVLDYFERTQPDPTTELTYSDPFGLLVAVMLSAQCTDKRVNMVTPALLAAYPTPASMANANTDQILHYIKSVSYPNSKAQHLIAMAPILGDKFDVKIPGTMETLTQLPGVGRKTANVMLGMVFGAAAIPVDTHVFRVANRLGLANGKTPLEVEKQLIKHIPAEKRFKAHHWILLHGRYVCKAQRPDCPNCGISSYCKTFK